MPLQVPLFQPAPGLLVLQFATPHAAAAALAATHASECGLFIADGKAEGGGREGVCGEGGGRERVCKHRSSAFFTSRLEWLLFFYNLEPVVIFGSDAANPVMQACDSVLVM